MIKKKDTQLVTQPIDDDTVIEFRNVTKEYKLYPAYSPILLNIIITKARKLTIT